MLVEEEKTSWEPYQNNAYRMLVRESDVLISS
jgi:hypothetical protein